MTNQASIQKKDQHPARPSSDLAARIVQMRNDELRASARTIHIAVILIIVLNIQYDIVYYGARPVWIFLRLAFIPFSLLSLKLYKLRVLRNFPAMGLIAISGYCMAMLAYFICSSDFLTSHYWKGFLQGQIIMTLLPVSVPVYLLMNSLVLMASVVCLAALPTPIDWSTFGATLSGVATNVSVIFTAFYLSHKLRNAFYRSKIELQDTIRDRDAVIQQQVSELASARVNAAIAQTTQMLAHDVRRPFSFLKMGLQTLRSTTSPDKIRSLASKLHPAVEGALASVEGLLQDIMEIGASRAPNCEATSPVSLIEISINEIFRFRDGTEISLVYQLDHVSSVNVSSVKALRVFHNILDNAVHAMKKRGTISFRTADISNSQGHFVEFTIANTNSKIADEDRPKIFTAFFTKGKSNGTGLGLAISQKIVQDHGGTIFCRSTAHGVEFTFTLPALPHAKDERTRALPGNSQDIFATFKAFTDPDTLNQDPVIQTKYEYDLLTSVKNRGTKVSILILDDEAVYTSFLHAELSHDAEIAGLIQVTVVHTVAAALDSISLRYFDLIITDLDLGPHAQERTSVVRDLRQVSPTSYICIHSNHSTAESLRIATLAGADSFYPKPMSRSHLLSLIEKAQSAQTMAPVKRAQNEAQ